MGWKTLADHFRSATGQDPAPCGEGAIEWDYSRYARALGLTAQPGIDDLPRTGCALVVGSPVGWERAWRDYADLAAIEGWRAIRVSARPTVVVPDPVVHGLGTAIAGSDGLIFARSGRFGEPALGKRPRPPGCSIPLASGERWLIASDRVRRRMCNEIAVRGTLVFVEEAHRVTAAALGMIAYWLKCHRAWQARMLSRDAKIYVVLATPTDHEQSLRDALERFDVTGTIPARRVRRRLPTTPSTYRTPRPPTLTMLSVEEEHMLSALAHAPLALTSAGIRDVFGVAGLETADHLVERGVFRIREEYGHRCYVPTPEQAENAPPPPHRVLQALQAHYRTLKRGHTHVEIALADLAHRLHQPHRALCHIIRTPPSTTATIPLDQYEKARAADLGASASVLVSMFGAETQQRRYARAKALATFIANGRIVGTRRSRQLFRAVFSTGRVHLDQSLGPQFWADLSAGSGATSMSDALCVLADVYSNLRFLTAKQVRERFESAIQCMRSADHDRAATWELDLVKTLRDRVAVYLGTSAPPMMGLSQEAIPRTFDRSVPAYLWSTSIVSHLQCRASTLDDDERATWCTALDLVRATGDPRDSRVQLRNLFQRLMMDRLGLALRPTADELFLLLDSALHPRLRHSTVQIVQKITGARARLVSASGLSRQRSGELAGLDSLGLGISLLARGDVGNARETLRSALVRLANDPDGLALTLCKQLSLARKTLAWRELEQLGRTVDIFVAQMPSALASVCGAYHQGSRSLVAGELGDAESYFCRARNELRSAHQGARWPIYLMANQDVAMCRRSRALIESSVDVVGMVLGILACHQKCGTWAQDPWGRVGQSLDYIVVALERRSAHKASLEQLARVVIALRESVDKNLRDAKTSLVRGIAECAPGLFRQITATVRDSIGLIGSAVPTTEALDSALRVLGDVHVDVAGGDGLSERFGFGDTYCVQVLDGSLRRSIRRVASAWQEDASTYHEIVGRSRTESSFTVSTFADISSDPMRGRRLEMPVTVHRRRRRIRITMVVPSNRAGRLRKDGAFPSRRARQNMGLRFLGRSESARAVREQVERAAKCGLPVLLFGETGVGKELVARLIHEKSERGHRAMVTMDCAALANSVIESELFGHKCGAFTGAVTNHQGMVERADGSTLFLDNVAGMSPRMQAALLRSLETGEYRRVGSVSQRRSDFRLVSSARSPAAVEPGSFRPDLFFRLSTLRIEIPPLRERPQDAYEIAIAICRRHGKVLLSECRDLIENYSWPGNVRQLQHCLSVAGLDGPDVGHAALGSAIESYGDLRPREAHPRAQTDFALERLPRVFSARDYALAARVSKRTAQRRLANLVVSRTLCRQGAGRATLYLQSTSGARWREPAAGKAAGDSSN